MNKKTTLGHIAAAICVAIWGTTFVSTKVLLQSLNSLEILLCRFVLGYIALCILCPRPQKPESLLNELKMMVAGLCGITLYYLLSNIALEQAPAANVSIILSMSPLFTVLLLKFLKKGGKSGIGFYIGFVLAVGGICVICIRDSGEMGFISALLCLAAAASWAIYTVLTQDISQDGSLLKSTRRTAFYGLLLTFFCCLPKLGSMDLSRLCNPSLSLNLGYLGCIAFSGCMVIWNWSVKTIGAAKAGVYSYATPVVTAASAALILDEAITVELIVGILLVCAGLVFSQRSCP